MNIEKKIWLSLAHMGGNELDYIKEAFSTNWVVPLGPNVDGFEKDLEQYLGYNKKVVALSSGTASLHLALLQLDIKPGDEVICQSFTFSASANPIAYIGAKPVFVDSEEDTWNIDPVFLEEAIQDRKIKTGKYPKAVIVVHLYGMPAKLEELSLIAKKYNIPIVEDAAEALGSSYKNQKCGTFGDFSILSFNGNKIITTSGGGALVCRNEDIAYKTKFYATQARENMPYYYHKEIGYNYRLSNICAGIGRGQMKVLQEHVNRRREIHKLYSELFSDFEGISVKQEPTESFNSNFWLTCLTVNKTLIRKTPTDIMKYLVGKNIESRLLWRPMHLQPIFENCPFYGQDISERLFNEGLCVPSGSILSNNDIVRVVEEIKLFINLK